MRLQTIAILAASLLAGGALTGAVAQAAGMADVIKARHGNFEKMGKAMKAIMGELKRPNPSLAVIRPNAQVLNTRAQLVANGFPRAPARNPASRPRRWRPSGRSRPNSTSRAASSSRRPARSCRRRPAATSPGSRRRRRGRRLRRGLQGLPRPVPPERLGRSP